MSGILTGLMVRYRDQAWRLAFVAGVIVGPFLIIVFGGSPLDRHAVASGPVFYISAFLVGLGTAVGSGCTSGHGICGLSRLSPRSMVAVTAFMVSAVITVFFVQFLGRGV